MIKFTFNNLKNINNSSGVYCIINLLNNKKYIGSSINLKLRISQHRSELRTGKHHSRYLQNAYNKYGEDNFEIWILELCDPIRDTLLFLELKYLDLQPEYNVATIAYIPDATLNAKLVHMYSLSGEYIMSFRCRKDAASYLKLNGEGMSIFYCCSGKIKLAYGYIWSYVRKKFIYKYKKRYSAETKIEQCDDNWNVVKLYDSIKLAATQLGNTTSRVNISNCLAGKRKHAFGFKWRYLNK